MITDYDFESIVVPIMDWYKANARKLPWREDRDAYHIWVSEIMLQQTRVEAVVGYYNRFMEVLPDIEHLAKCPEDQLMKLWEGLGYYNRVRNLQKAACTIVENHDGMVPVTSKELERLSGIGSYTSRAIASQAFNEPVASVDGNVLRVVTRLAADNTDIIKESFKRRVEETLDDVIPRDNAGDFNQAMMELGATVCVPNGEPRCGVCPLNGLCRSNIQGTFMKYPVKTKSKARRIENRTVFIIRNSEQILINKRSPKGLLAGLYEFPNVEGHLNQDEGIAYVKDLGFEPIRIKRLAEAKHIFSHIEWNMIGYEVRIDETTRNRLDGMFVEIRQIEKKYSIPAAFETYKKALNIVSGTTMAKRNPRVSTSELQ